MTPKKPQETKKGQTSDQQDKRGDEQQRIIVRVANFAQYILYKDMDLSITRQINTKTKKAEPPLSL